MSEELYHYGIKGMKWGVRRTPAQLGHVTAGKKSSRESKASKPKEKKTPGKTSRITSSLSDDELQRRVNRLNLEERYDDLVARQKARYDTGIWPSVKKAAAKHLGDFGNKVLSNVVDMAVKKIFDKKFDINNYKDMDINDMDADTIAIVAKWYENATKINSGRSKLRPTDSDSGKSSKEDSSGNKSSSSDSDSTSNKPKWSSTDYTRRQPYGDNRSSYKRPTQKQLREWVRQNRRAIRNLK